MRAFPHYIAHENTHPDTIGYPIRCPLYNGDTHGDPFRGTIISTDRGAHGWTDQFTLISSIGHTFVIANTHKRNIRTNNRADELPYNVTINIAYYTSHLITL